MEVLRIKVYLTGHSEVAGNQGRVVMLPFEGSCDMPFFEGVILPGGVDTQHIGPDGRCSLSARYMLEGRDSTGTACKIFIENEGVSSPAQPMVTHPVIYTDSEALRWLETADLTGAIEHFEDHIEIVLSSGDSCGAQEKTVQRLALKRAGLTLRGCLEKKKAGKAPLVLMLHGFGGAMDAHPEGWFQRISDVLTEAGLATLRFDFNGHGESGGDFSDMTPFNELEDAAVFLKYALSREDVSEVYLLGHSQGGVIAGMLAGCFHDHVKKLVMLVPAASLKTDAIEGHCMGVVYDPAHIPDTVTVAPGRQVGGLYYRIAQTLPIYEMTAQFQGKALAVIGGRDCVVRADAIRCYGETMKNCQVVEKPTLDHGLGGDEYLELMEEIQAFLLN